MFSSFHLLVSVYHSHPRAKQVSLLLYPTPAGLHSILFPSFRANDTHRISPPFHLPSEKQFQITFSLLVLQLVSLKLITWLSLSYFPVRRVLRVNNSPVCYRCKKWNTLKSFITGLHIFASAIDRENPLSSIKAWSCEDDPCRIVRQPCNRISVSCSWFSLSFWVRSKRVCLSSGPSPP